MKILVLNGSPRPLGNTAALVDAFKRGAEEAGHNVEVLSAGTKKIAGCLGCEYCHTKGQGKCVQQDDMKELYAALEEAEMLVFASPVYYFTLTAQIQSAIHRTYAIGVPGKLKKTALILSSGSDHVYDASISQYRAVISYWKVEDAGVHTAYGNQNKSAEKLEELYQFGHSL